jgi:hypothetical protein
MSTPGIGLSHLTSGQSSKYASVNAIGDGLDGGLTQLSVIDVSGSADVSPAASAVLPFMVLQLIGILTGNIGLKLPSAVAGYGTSHLYLIKNMVPYKQWTPNTVHAVNDTCVDPSGHIQKVTARTGDFKTGTVTPSWNDSGSTTTDNHVTWTDQGAATSYTVTVKSVATWVAATAMALGQVIVDASGHVQKVTAVTGDAKTDGSTPSFSTTGGATTDNHVTWTDQGAAATVVLNPGDIKLVYSDGGNVYKPN